MLTLNKYWLFGIFTFFLSIGLIGLFSPFEPHVMDLSEANLLLTIALVSLSYRTQLKNYLQLIGIAFGIGYLAELIGVHTGWLFGNYTYETNLGLKVGDVPLLIGINWAILCLGAWELSKFIHEKWLRILYSAALLVLFDYVMEPVAVYLNFWSWQGGIIPLFNYISWFLISLFILIFIAKYHRLESGISKWVLLGQFIFFLILNLKCI